MDDPGLTGVVNLYSYSLSLSFFLTTNNRATPQETFSERNICSSNTQEKQISTVLSAFSP